jgi:mRNA-degrading endonuclease RelE of RelBE toxin-antitoxin system
MNWTVRLNKKVEKQLTGLPKGILNTLKYLIKEIEVLGPIRGNWQNFGPLTNDRYHCHIKKGRPTYVVVWEIVSKKERHIEVIYVGTHEGAPYQKH